MVKESPKISKREAVSNAANEHKEVCRFLKKASVRKKLPKKTKQADSEVELLHWLLILDGPITYNIEALKNIGSESTVSAAIKRLNKILSDFSNEFEGLREKNIIITIPSHRGGLQIGRYFTCQNTFTGKYLNATEIRNILQETWDKFKKANARKNWLQTIERHLRRKLYAEAKAGLSKKLHGRESDYLPLVMEIGHMRAEKETSGADFLAPENELRPEDYNRSWVDFDSNELLNPQGTYILSSDTGTGKTTSLRDLQRKVIDQGQLIPIVVHASVLEDLDFEDVSSFIPYLVEILKLKLPKNQVKSFLKKHFNRVRLFVDGLDQIEGAGTDYSDLLDKLLRIFGKNLVIASRPFAVISQDQNSKVNFLRLKPFARKAQQKYFGRHYSRAFEICDSCRELMAIPMLAYMVRHLIENKQDENIKTRTDVYKQFTDYILTTDEGYKHEKIRSTVDVDTQVRQMLAEISYHALANDVPHIQKIPVSFSERYAIRHKTTVERLLKHGLVKLIVDRSLGIDKFLYFSHQSFQEYLAAEWAEQNHEFTKRILDEMWNPKWKEVIKFLTGLSKEDFVKKIYSPGCKDNCIHSRLFLAAECCSESSETSPSEELIISELQKLLWIDLFCEKSLLMMSKLKSAHAVDYLLTLITDTETCPAVIEDNITPFFWQNMLARMVHKLESWHIDSLVEFLMRTDKSQLRHYSDWAFLLSDLVTDAQITRIVQAAIRGERYAQLFCGRLLCLSRTSSKLHIRQLCSLLAAEDETIVLAALRIITEIAYIPLDYELSLIDRVPTPGYDLLAQISSRLVPPLFRCLNNGTRPIKEKACIALGYLAIMGNLSAECIHRLVVSLGDIVFLMHNFIAECIARWYDRKFPGNTELILGFLSEANSWTECVAMEVLSQVEQQVPNELVSKVAPFLKSHDGGYRFLALTILEKAGCTLSGGQVNAITDLLKPRDDRWKYCYLDFVCAAIRTLSAHSKGLRSAQIDQILDHVDAIESDIEFSPFFETRFDAFKRFLSCSILPVKLTRSQINRIGRWLSCPFPFKRKLGVELLANVGEQLPERYVHGIAKLLHDSEPSVIIRALHGLDRLRERLTSEDIASVISCLRIRVSEVGYAVRDCLIAVNNRLTCSHLDELLAIMEDGDAEAATRAFEVLRTVSVRVTDEFPVRLVSFLYKSHGYYHEKQIIDRISEFGHHIGPTETDQIVKLIEGVRSGAQGLAITALSKLQCNVTPSVIGRVIRCLEHLDNSGRIALAELLRRFGHMVDEDDAESILRFYIRNPSLKNVEAILCAIPRPLIAQHINSITKLLDSNVSTVKASVLWVLESFYEHLTANDLARIKCLLDHTDNEICISACEVLKKAYTAGLPIPTITSCRTHHSA